jgi:hypothetical protein
MSGANALTRIGVLPFDGFGGGVVLADVGHQLAMEVLGRGEDAAIDEVTLDFAEPKLDLVEPGRVGRGEVKLDSRVCGQKLLDSLGLVGRQVVQDDVDLLTPRLAGDDGAEESDELLAGVPRSGLADDRAVPGHWEGDLILGLDSSSIGTLVERNTRYTILLHLPRLRGHGGPRVHNGPALAGHGADAVRDAVAAAITTLPHHLRKSLTWDQGAEMAQHAQLRIDTGVEIYFCDPQRPWQRGTNENTNGLLRQYFPKGTDLSSHGVDELEAVALALNSRPRKTLQWKTPAEALNEHLLSVQRHGVARIR